MDKQKNYGILVDIGGTHVRFAVAAYSGARTFDHVEKYVALEWSDFTGLLHHYLEAHDLKAEGMSGLYIASASRPITMADGNEAIKFDPKYKNNCWHIERHALEAEFGLDHCVMSVDVMAQFAALHGGEHTADDRGLFFTLDQDDGREAPTNNMLLMVSIGTGLGHAYGRIQDDAGVNLSAAALKQSVFPCFGGHMAPCATTQEQWDATHFIAGQLNGERHVIFEDILSGRGLYALYAFVCDQEGQAPAYEDIHAMLANGLSAGDKAVQSALRLFFEFLGLYINIVATSAHAFGGVFLVGAVFRHLYEHDQFNITSMRQYMRLDMVEVVDTAWKNTPVYLARKPHLTLHGLMEMMKKDCK